MSVPRFQRSQLEIASDFVVEGCDLFSAVYGDERIMDVQRPEQRADIIRNLFRLQLAGERSVNVVHIAALHDQHRSDVFPSLIEVLPIGRFGSQEAVQIECVIRIPED